MKQLQRLYQTYNNCITKWVFPVILLLYPLLKINQGIDVSDSTYSLGNYLFFERLEGTWVISTYLSNVIGWIFTKLPFGTTMLGMNLYTGLLVSGLAIGLYYLMKRWMPAWIVFVGEWIAISFLWIPTGILYNYLTYVFFALGAVVLYKGLVEEKNICLIVAGVLLGCNVWVRIPNLAEMALIVCVWYDCYLQKERYLHTETSAIKDAVKKTGYGIAGYAIGAAVPFIMILVQYGFGGIADMVRGLSQIQSSDDTYSVFSMIKATLEAYLRTGKWAGFVVAGIGMGCAMFAVKKELFIPIKKMLYLLGILVLFRFFWGRGMFSFRYYEDYTSMYEWGMLGLYLAVLACIYLFTAKGVSAHEKLWGMISLVVLCITPLGSNNYTYQNLNNLFLTAPITLYVFVKWFRRKYPDSVQPLLFPLKAMLGAVGFMILLQSAGFHLHFVFRDGMNGEKRDTVLAEPMTVAGMKTTQRNAENIDGLLTYMEKAKADVRSAKEAADTGKEEWLQAVYYGDCPGLSFLLQIPSAMDSSWPDLDSFSVKQMEENLKELEECPVVIVRNCEPTSLSFMEKKELLWDYMSARHYKIGYENDGYTVYQPME